MFPEDAMPPAHSAYAGQESITRNNGYKKPWQGGSEFGRKAFGVSNRLFIVIAVPGKTPVTGMAYARHI
jgi:hypothetical protein